MLKDDFERLTELEQDEKKEAEAFELLDAITAEKVETERGLASLRYLLKEAEKDPAEAILRAYRLGKLEALAL